MAASWIVAISGFSTPATSGAGRRRTARDPWVAVAKMALGRKSSCVTTVAEIDECADPLPPPSTVLECLVDVVLEGLDRPRVAENAPTSLTAAIVVALAAAGSVSAGIASKGTSTKRSLR
jgi:hypothetical protein